MLRLSILQGFQNLVGIFDIQIVTYLELQGSGHLAGNQKNEHRKSV